ncbi:MAG: tetratricopeptide repeat protein [Candidatus Latescibacteria bacterium]|nr:tetratricopeptide repeat protein [Candidatus Latescibacterota bacterium]
MKRLAFTAIIMLIVSLSAASSPEGQIRDAAARYNEAGALYSDGRFTEALALYEELVESGIENPDLYYNASNAAYRTNDLGKAILYLERAKKLAPSDEDIAANLAFLNSVKEDREPPESNAVAAFITKLYDGINVNDAALWSALSFALSLLCATAALFTLSWKRLVLVTMSIALGFCFAAATGIQLQKLHHASTTVEAVVMNDEAPAYSGPGAENTHIFTIHEGMKVVIERSQEGWSLIRLRSGVGGWIRSGLMEVI